MRDDHHELDDLIDVQVHARLVNHDACRIRARTIPRASRS